MMKTIESAEENRMGVSRWQPDRRKKQDQADPDVEVIDYFGIL